MNLIVSAPSEWIKIILDFIIGPQKALVSSPYFVIDSIVHIFTVIWKEHCQH